jgi:hypothetical protein
MPQSRKSKPTTPGKQKTPNEQPEKTFVNSVLLKLENSFEKKDLNCMSSIFDLIKFINLLISIGCASGAKGIDRFGDHFAPSQ